MVVQSVVPKLNGCKIKVMIAFMIIFTWHGIDRVNIFGHIYLYALEIVNKTVIIIYVLILQMDK